MSIDAVEEDEDQQDLDCYSYDLYLVIIQGERLRVLDSILPVFYGADQAHVHGCRAPNPMQRVWLSCHPLEAANSPSSGNSTLDAGQSEN